MIIFVIFTILILNGLILFLIYLFISTKYNDKLTNSLDDISLNTYKIKYNKLKDKVNVYGSHYHKMHSYSCSEFLNLFEKEKKTAFLEWINSSSTNPGSFICKVKDIDNENETRLIAFIIISIKDDTINIKGRRIDDKDANKYLLINDVKIKEYNVLTSLYKNQNHKLNNISYFLLCINMNSYDYIERRYGKSIADNYVKYVYSLLKEVAIKHSLLTHYQKDSYLLIVPTLISKLSIQIVANNIINKLNKIIFIDMYQFELKPKIGITAFNLNKNDIEIKINNAYKASIDVKENNYKFYDNSLRKKEEIEKHKKNELINVFENMDKYGYYYPIISLNNGNTVGYLEFIRYHSENFKYGNELYDYALENNLKDFYEKNLFYKSFELFNNFHSRKSNNALMIIKTSALEHFINFYEKEKNKINYNLILVFSDYKDLNLNNTNLRNLLIKAKKLGIGLGVVVNDRSSTTLTKYYSIFNWLLIDNNITNNILNDTRNKWIIKNIIDITEPFNLKVLAYNIKDIKTAELLKELGVEYIEGPLLDKRNEDYVSIRSLEKLIDEREDA